jgi:hypothetical protein
LFLAVQDLKGLHLEGSAEVVVAAFPTCWELEVIDLVMDRNAGGYEDRIGDVYVRYV